MDHEKRRARMPSKLATLAVIGLITGLALKLRPTEASHIFEGSYDTDYWTGKISQLISDEYPGAPRQNIEIDDRFPEYQRTSIAQNMFHAAEEFYEFSGKIPKQTKTLKVVLIPNGNDTFENTPEYAEIGLRLNSSRYEIRHEYLHALLDSKLEETSAKFREGLVDYFVTRNSSDYQSGLTANSLESIALQNSDLPYYETPDQQLRRVHLNVYDFVFRQLFKRLNMIPRYKDMDKNLFAFIANSDEHLKDSDIFKWLNKATNGASKRILDNYPHFATAQK